MSSYRFGIEIEIVAEPHKVHYPFDIRLYYEKLAAALRKRNEKAKADDGSHGYRKHPEHYNKWWITWDGSLMRPTEPEYPLVPLEAVSPIMDTEGRWENQVDVFWTSFSRVFHMPKKLKRCGSHVHISKRGSFSLSELKRIAWCTVYHESAILELLPLERRDHTYAQPNSKVSSQLKYSSLEDMGRTINKAEDFEDLVYAMQGLTQDDRYVLWNFANVLKASDTLEFRGGRCLRGRVRTKRWVAFTTSFVHYCLEQNQSYWRKEVRRTRPSANKLYESIRDAGDDLDMQVHLPKDYRILNEEKKSSHNEDSYSNSDDSLSDDASIVSKSLAPRHRSNFCVIL